MNIPGATSGDIVDKIDDVVEGKPESLIVVRMTIRIVGTNDLTNNVNLLSNVKKIVSKVKNRSPILR